MNLWLLAASLLCFALAIGHTVVGVRWILPGLEAETLPTSPFGGGALTVDALRVVWHLIGVMVVTAGALLAVLAGRATSSDGVLAARAVGVMFAAATVVVVWQCRPRPQHLLRAPVWILFLMVAALCWLGT